MDNINKLTTSSEFSEFYFKKLKNKLNLTDINLNKLGFIGFFIELLGNVQFDVKNYYEYLFNEAFPISAFNNENLLYHSSVYGYLPYLAKPAEIVGKFNLSPTLSEMLDSATKREILLSNISFIIDQLEYRLDSFYKLTYSRYDNEFIKLNCEIVYNNEYDLVPVFYSNSSVKTVGLLQYSIQEESFDIPGYTYGNYYTNDTITLNNSIYNLEIKIKDKDAILAYGRDNDEGYVDFKPVTLKSFVSADENVVFYSVLADNILRLQFGSGRNGRYVPNSMVKIKIKNTMGEKGNIINQTVRNVSGDVLIYDYDANGELLRTSNVNAKNVLSLDITHGIGGKNAPLDDKLRTELLEYIQTRENLVSETDFHNNLKDYSKDSEILFKKSEIAENTIYLYTRIYNKYALPVYTLTELIPRLEFEEQLFTLEFNDKFAVYPEFERYGKTFVLPFYFEYNQLLKTYDGFVYYNFINFYPNVTNINVNDTDIVKDLYLSLSFYPDTNTTRIYVKSQTSFIDKVENIQINSQLLAISASSMDFTVTEDSFYYTYEHGVIKRPVVINIKLQVNQKVYEYIFYNVQTVFDVSSILRLKSYHSLKDNSHYFINVPLIDKEEFFKDTEYYTDTIRDIYTSINVKENRMVSDEIQMRFLNTFISSQKFNVHLLKQKYDFDIILPFKLKVEVTFSKNDVYVHQVKINAVSNQIKMDIGKFLIESSTGLNLNFYKTKIIDICHNYQYVKFVTVEMTDNVGTPIPNGSIESVLKDELIENFDKYLYLEYTPHFWWFDINELDFKVLLL